MKTGHDVGEHRLDDLDRMIIRDSLAEPFEPQIIGNFGSGKSSLSRVLGTLGHRVYNYDNRDLHLFFNMLKDSGSKQYFTQIDLREIKKHHVPKQMDAVVFQRVLHYLPYAQVCNTINLVLKGLRKNGGMYLSFSGLDSEIGKIYSAREESIESRWGSIAPDFQDKFSIDQEICLYTQSDVEQLIDSIEGLEIEQIWISQFGNIKCRARKIDGK